MHIYQFSMVHNGQHPYEVYLDDTNNVSLETLMPDFLLLHLCIHSLTLTTDSSWTRLHTFSLRQQ